jgi:Arc/MetJ family transcription regulator
MPINLAIDNELLNEAVRVGKHRTKKAAVNEALAEYVQRRKRLKLVDLFGKIDFHPQWNYKPRRGKR